MDAEKLEPKSRGKDYFTCTACGSGPWHKSWTAKHEPKWCPDCTGAD